MATLNKTREGQRNQKKGISVAHATIDFSEFDATGDVAELFELPENAHIARIHLNVKTAFNAGTSMVIVGKLGASTVMASISIATTGVKTLTVTQLDAGTGAQFTLTTTVVGAMPTAGKAEIMVEYIEYTKNSGELTDYSATTT